MIIGICGHKTHGKDTMAQEIAKIDPSFKITHFADTLKKVAASVFGVPLHFFYDQQLKERELEAPIDMDACVRRELESGNHGITKVRMCGIHARTAREVAQYFGTDYVRRADPDYWVRRTMQDVTAAKTNSWVIPDVRFANEAEAIKKVGGLVVRIVRDRVMTTDDPHPSEALAFDYDILCHVATGDYTTMRRFAAGLARMV